MASDYGLNFGFRRSDESVRVSEGRFRTPITGSALLIGTAVQIDPASAGFMKVCASAAPIVPGYAGLLVQEEIMIGSIYGAEVSLLDSFSLGVAKKNTLSVITTGAGTKVWFKNTLLQNRADGRDISAVTIWDTTTNTPALGDALGWDGTKFAKTATAAAQWMTVTAISTTTGYVEGVLLK
jgi:hypothetical protein